MKKKKEVLEKIHIAKLYSLPYLDLSQNSLTDLPDELFELSELKELNLSNNFLTYIDESNFSKLQKLLDLNLSGNSFNYNIGLPFPLGNNLPLRILNINYNNFQKLPKELLNLNFLEELKFENNPLTIEIPEEILNKDIKTFLKYHEELEVSKHVVKLYEGKVIFVGNGDVGKTSLIRKILYPSSTLNIGSEPTTKGISIKQTEIDSNDYNIEYILDKENRENNGEFDEYEEDEDGNYYDEDGNLIDPYDEDFTEHQRYNKIQLNIWDFGGQEIYHSTHQFFLTKRSVYIFVWESRKDEIISSFEYWLNIISILGKNSPVLVVQNKCDERINQIPKTQLINKFKNIKGFYNVSCKSGEGILELKKQLNNQVNFLPHIGSTVPKAWKDIKQQLERTNQNYINFEEFRKICKRYKIYDKRVDIISEYLHDLGIIIHFREDFILNDIVIINPEWGTNAVYSLIDQPDIIKNHGRFNKSDLEKFWNKKEYPKNKHGHLIQLMMKFELCFNVSGDNYILPELLPQEGKSFDEIVDMNSPDLIYKYDYSFLPSGIITRLICKISYMIFEDNFTKNSLIVFYENTFCTIKQELFEKDITLIFKGENSNELYSIIRNEISNINSNLNLIKDKEYKEKIACNCNECSSSNEPYFYDTITLRKFLEKNIEFIQCQNSAENLNIKILLKGYKPKEFTISLINLLLKCLTTLQAQKLHIGKNENARNSILCELLNKEKGIFVKDQTLQGSSPTGKSPGEIDLKVTLKNGEPLSIIEALNLKKYDGKYIDSHLDKIFLYDSNGLEENFILVYLEVKDFQAFIQKYSNHINQHRFQHPLISNFQDISKASNSNSETFVGLSSHNRNGSTAKLYHIIINFS